MIGGDPDVSRALFDHVLYGAQHAADSANLAPLRVDCRRNGEEVPEELVGAVDQVNVHMGPSIANRGSLISWGRRTTPKHSRSKAERCGSRIRTSRISSWRRSSLKSTWC